MISYRGTSAELRCRHGARSLPSELALVMFDGLACLTGNNKCATITRRPALDAPQRRLSRTVPRWPSLVIGHYRRYARSKCNSATWGGLPATCPLCSSLVIMPLALPARNHLCRSVGQRQLFSDNCAAASCITPKVAVSLITNTPDSRVAQGSTLSPSSSRLGSRSRLPQTCHSHQG